MIRPMLLSEIASLVGGVQRGADVRIQALSTDSRAMSEHALFVALRGENFDGNRFVAAAKASGAVAALVSSPSDELPCVEVQDSRLALGLIARENRRAYRRPLIALTGSSGKTTTKELLAAILSEEGAVLATRGNLNNEIGVPLTLLAIDSHHRYAVTEMGAAKSGDIAYLCQFAEPDIAILTNAQAAHIAGFGSLDGVARAKGEIFSSLTADGVAVINLDDAYAELWLQMASHCQRRTVSLSSPQADVYASELSRGSDGQQIFTLNSFAGRIAIRLSLPGEHMVRNALAAAAAALSAGVSLESVASGLAKASNAEGRLSRHSIAGITLFDDSYNANPGSVAAAIKVLAEQGGSRHLVMGTMAELGNEASRHHRDIARLARQAGIEALYCVGEFAEMMAAEFGEGGRAFNDKTALQQAVLQEVRPGDAVLVKGSRSAAMDTVVQALKTNLNGESH